MKWGFKLVLVLFVIVFFIFIGSYKLISEPTIINTHSEYAYIPSGRSGYLSIFNTTTDKIEDNYVYTGRDAEGVTVSPDGSKVYVTNGYLNILSVIDTKKNNIISKVNVGENPIGVAISPDGKKVYVANNFNNNVSVIDTSKNEVLYSIDVGINPLGIAISSDGKKVYVANFNSRSVSVIDTTFGEVKNVDLSEDYPFGVAVTPDGKKVYVTHDESNIISVINTENCSNYTVKLDPYKSGNKGKLCPHGVAVSPDGKTVYVANHRIDIKGISDTPLSSVYVINTSNDTVIAKIGVDKGSCGIAVSRSGTKVYVANGKSDTVSIINITNNYSVESVKVGTMPSAFGQFIGSPNQTAIYNPTWVFIREKTDLIKEAYYRALNFIWEETPSSIILMVIFGIIHKTFSLLNGYTVRYIYTITDQKVVPICKENKLLKKILESLEKKHVKK
jgi:YVTN family beta-propeller protein